MPKGHLWEGGSGNSLILPVRVIRPILPFWPLATSVNQRLPSGPATISPGASFDGGSANSWKMPLIPCVGVDVGDEPGAGDALHPPTRPARNRSSTSITKL